MAGSDSIPGYYYLYIPLVLSCWKAHDDQSLVEFFSMDAIQSNCSGAIKPWYTDFILVVLCLAIIPHTRAIKVKVSLEFLSNIKLISVTTDGNKTK